MKIEGVGTGPIDFASADALAPHRCTDVGARLFRSTLLQSGSNASAISYVEIEHPGGRLFGVGINTNIVAASLEAIVSAANRIVADK